LTTFVYELMLLRSDIKGYLDFYVALDLDEALRLKDKLNERDFSVVIFRYNRNGNDLRFNGIVAVWNLDEAIDYVI